MKKITRKIITTTLALSLIVGSMPIAVMAATDNTAAETINYVSLGDSMTNGYGQIGYEEEKNNNKSFDTDGFRQTDMTNIYPYFLSEYLRKLHPNARVNWEQLALSGMRTEDVNFLLRFHTEDEAWQKTVSRFNQLEDSSAETWDNIKDEWYHTFRDNGVPVGDYLTFRMLVQGFANSWGSVEGVVDKNRYPWVTNGNVAYARYYQNRIKDADVISMSLGNANLVVGMIQDLVGALGVNGYTFTTGNNVDDLIKNRVCKLLYPCVQSAADALNKALESIVAKAGISKDTAAKLERSIEYTFISMFVTYLDTLEAINDLKEGDKVDIINLGLVPAFNGVKLDLGDGNALDYGELYKTCVDVFDAYFFMAPTVQQKLKKAYKNLNMYAVPAQNNVQMLTTDMSNVDNIKDNKVLRKWIINSVKGEVHGFIGPALEELGYELVPLSVEDVEAYEKIKSESGNYSVEDKKIFLTTDTSKTEVLTTDKAFTAAVYCAFEKIVAKNAERATINVSDIIEYISGGDALANYIKDKVISQIVDSDDDLVKIISVDNAIWNSFENDDLIGNLIYAFDLALVGSGMGIHPNAKGHETIFEGIKKIYPSTDADKLIKQKTKQVVKDIHKTVVEKRHNAIKTVWSNIKQKINNFFNKLFRK